MGKITNFFFASPANDFRPPALSYKAFLAYGLLMLVLRVLLGALPVESAAVESQTLLTLINDERQARNLNTLITNSSLLAAASQKAQDMIDRDYFDHVDPDGSYVWPKIIAAGYGAYKILGENLAVDFATSEGMIKAWLDSPKHRDNLLHTDFLDQGLSALYGDYNGRYTNLTASLFGAKQSFSSPSPKPAPPPPAPPPAVESVQQPPAPIPPPQAPPTPTPNPAPLPQAPPPPAPTKVPEMNLSGRVPTPPATNPQQVPSNFFSNLGSAYSASRILFTLFGVLLLLLLGVDSVIIHKHEAQMAAGSVSSARSHSSYHFFSLIVIVMVSILIWWW